MENSLFRKKSMDRISSPEELHDYMRVTTPRLWMILTAIVVLLAGFIVFASVANMENTMPIKVTVENFDLVDEKTGEVVHAYSPVFYADMPVSYKDTLETGMKVRLGDEEGKIDLIAMVNDENGNQELSLMIEMDNESLQLKDGEYDAELVLESTTPISFLWN